MTAGARFLVLELVDGESLADHLVCLKADTTGTQAPESAVSGFSRTRGLPVVVIARGQTHLPL